MHENRPPSTPPDPERPLTAREQQLVTAHLRWSCGAVRRLARRYQAGLTEQDVQQLALLGLSKAARAFEESLGVPFAGFALKFVQGAVKTAAKVEHRFHGALAADCQTWTDEGDLLEETEEEALSKLYARAGQAAGAMLFGVVSTRSGALAGGGEDEMLRAIVHKRIHDALSTVPERPREVIERRLLRDQEIKEVAAEMGISASTVRRDYDEWMPKLQRRLVKAGLEP